MNKTIKYSTAKLEDENSRENKRKPVSVLHKEDVFQNRNRIERANGLEPKGRNREFLSEK